MQSKLPPFFCPFLLKKYIKPHATLEIGGDNMGCYIILRVLGFRNRNANLITKGNKKWLVARIASSDGYKVICIDNFSEKRVYLAHGGLPGYQQLSQSNIPYYLEWIQKNNIIQAAHHLFDDNYKDTLNALQMEGYFTQRTVTRLLCYISKYLELPKEEIVGYCD